MVSLVDNGLFLMPSILTLASAVVAGEPSSRKPTPTAAAAPASAVPARNLRRSKYRPFGVISDDAMSADFLINMKTVLNSVYGNRRERFAVRRPHIDRTQAGEKSYKCHAWKTLRATSPLYPSVETWLATSQACGDRGCGFSRARPALPGLCAPAFAG